MEQREENKSPSQNEGGETQTTEQKSNEELLKKHFGYLMHVDNDHVRTYIPKA